MTPTFLVHIHADGVADYHVFGTGDARFLVVDERSPHDRVYRLTVRSPRHLFDEIVPPGTEIGDCADARHAALAGQIKAALTGDPALRLVESPP